MSNNPRLSTFIDPFVDWSFKRLFASEESKPILIGLLNLLFRGSKHIIAIEYGKTEYPGESKEEGTAIVDVTCTDADGSIFIIEIQRGYQKHFIDRSLFYLSRAISDQAPKGSRKEWAYKLKEVYLIAFLEDFRLPNSSRRKYLSDICLANRHTGKIFYDKMSLFFIEMLNFVKGPTELTSNLDRWLYALKHLTEFKIRPDYLSGPEFDQLFNMAKYASLTREERAMYNASLKRKWDNKNVMDYAVETAEQRGLEKGLERGLEKGEHKKAIEIAREMKKDQFPMEKIAKLTKLSTNEIKEL